MRRRLDICQRCDQFVARRGGYLCYGIPFDRQLWLDGGYRERDNFFDGEPPDCCPFRLEHLVLTQKEQ